jgi:hypothetical protein
LLFSRDRVRDGAIKYVIARICMFGRQICTITDGETDATVEIIQAQSRICVFAHRGWDNGRKKRSWELPFKLRDLSLSVVVVVLVAWRQFSSFERLLGAAWGQHDSAD